MNKKINCLEGIRTIACISVFLCHFRGAFSQEFSYWGDNTPLRILTAGNVMVRILFVLSGFVISYKYFAFQRYEEIPLDIFKRYFRLAPSILVANIVVHVMMELGLLYNVQAGQLSGSESFLAVFNNFEPDIGLCLKEGILTCYLQGANAYIGPLWTIAYEYLGGILVLCAIYVCKNDAFRYLFYIIFLCVFSSYYNYFVLGMLVCDIYCDKDISGWLKQHQHVNNMLFISALFIVSLIDINDDVKATRVLFAIGMCIFLLTLLSSSWGDKVLGNRFMREGGKLSFAVYIVHWPIIESFSSKYFIWLAELGYKDGFAVVSNLLLSGLLILVVAYFFNKYVELLGQTIMKSFVEKMRKFK